jgi:hypothetical protein
MIQRGRKSSNVVALGVTSSSPRLTPPATLSKAEKALFDELVASSDPQHFVPSDMPLLVSFVQATLLARSLASTAAKPSKPDPTVIGSWEKASRVMAMLATRLRLAPQARNDPKTVGVRQRNAAMLIKPPWADEDEDDDDG